MIAANMPTPGRFFQVAKNESHPKTVWRFARWLCPKLKQARHRFVILFTLNGRDAFRRVPNFLEKNQGRRGIRPSQISWQLNALYAWELVLKQLDPEAKRLIVFDLFRKLR